MASAVNPAHNRILRVLRNGGTLVSVNDGTHVDLVSDNKVTVARYTRRTIDAMVGCDLLTRFLDRSGVNQWRVTGPGNEYEQETIRVQSDAPAPEPVTAGDINTIAGELLRRKQSPADFHKTVQDHATFTEFLDALGGPDRVLRIVAELDQLMFTIGEMQTALQPADTDTNN